MYALHEKENSCKIKFNACIMFTMHWFICYTVCVFIYEI
jgi:hypothetical protein